MLHTEAAFHCSWEHRGIVCEKHWKARKVNKRTFVREDYRPTSSTRELRKSGLIVSYMFASGDVS